MKKVKIKEEYIQLGQFLKLIQVVDSGAMAKMVILDGLIKVNDEVETRRGKKLYHGDVVSFNDEHYMIDHVNQ